MTSPLIEVASFRNWALHCWRWNARRLWAHRRWHGLIPTRASAWSGKIRYFHWGPLTLENDRRGDMVDALSDMTGVRRGELLDRLRNAEGEGGDGE